MSGNHLRNAAIRGQKPGTFVKARLSGRRGHVTLMLEGSDEDGPSVAGAPFDAAGIDALILRLQNLRRAMGAPLTTEDVRDALRVGTSEGDAARRLARNSRVARRR